VSSITKKRVNGHIVQGNFKMGKHSDVESLKKREKIQNHFWNQVGSNEHISLPMLEAAIKKEFNYKDDRSIQSQINLMQTEARIRVESRVKVWIKQPNTNF
jgi:coproporphyrinogen III oxidase-like Fe-S oxidoreductase